MASGAGGSTSKGARVGARGPHGRWQLWRLQPVAEWVWELHIDWGPGYRMYYAQAGKRLVLLLTGGDKRAQQADIATALTY